MRAKPEPDLFLACQERMGVRREDVYVVGDAVWDLLAARRAGMLSVGLLSGGYAVEELLQAGAFRVYRDPGELLGSLDELGILGGEPTMKYRALGASGLKVSPICLGTMLFGSRTDEAEAGAHRAARRATPGSTSSTPRSRTPAAGARPSSATCWPRIGTGGSSPPRSAHGRATVPNEDGTNRRQIQASIEQSLRRLRTDRVDLYYLHRDDETTPLRESLFTVGDLIRAGKVLYLGLSNFRGWRLAEAVGICRELGIPSADRAPALLPRAEPTARGGAPPGRRPFRPRRRARTVRSRAAS